MIVTCEYLCRSLKARAYALIHRLTRVANSSLYALLLLMWAAEPRWEPGTADRLTTVDYVVQCHKLNKLR